MLTVGAWAELRGCMRAACLEAGATIIPPQPARWTVLDEHGGGKRNGEPYTRPRRTIVALYVGAVVRTR